jgi:hypothetical protein
MHEMGIEGSPISRFRRNRGAHRGAHRMHQTPGPYPAPFETTQALLRSSGAEQLRPASTPMSTQPGTIREEMTRSWQLPQLRVRPWLPLEHALRSRRIPGVECRSTSLPLFAITNPDFIFFESSHPFHCCQSNNRPVQGQIVRPRDPGGFPLDAGPVSLPIEANYNLRYRILPNERSSGKQEARVDAR